MQNINKGKLPPRCIKDLIPTLEHIRKLDFSKHDTIDQYIQCSTVDINDYINKSFKFTIEWNCYDISLITITFFICNEYKYKEQVFIATVKNIKLIENILDFDKVYE